MNYDDHLESFLIDCAKINLDFLNWDNRPKNFSTIDYKSTYFNNQPPYPVSLIMLTGSSIAYDFMMYYAPVIDADIQKYGPKHQITRSHVTDYIQTITSCLRVYLEYQLYPHSFEGNDVLLNAIKIKRNFFAKANSPLLEQLVKERRRLLSNSLIQCDFLSNSLEYLYHSLLKFEPWTKAYSQWRGQLNRAYHLDLISEERAKEKFFSQLNGNIPSSIDSLKDAVSRFKGAKLF